MFTIPGTQKPPMRSQGPPTTKEFSRTREDFQTPIQSMLSQTPLQRSVEDAKTYGFGLNPQQQQAWQIGNEDQQIQEAQQAQGFQQNMQTENLKLQKQAQAFQEYIESMKLKHMMSKP